MTGCQMHPLVCCELRNLNLSITQFLEIWERVHINIFFFILCSCFILSEKKELLLCRFTGLNIKMNYVINIS